MRWIVITSPSDVQGEASKIVNLIETGVDTIHLRKPYATKDQYAGLIKSIPEKYYGRIVIHDHFSLCCDYALGGIHLNRRNPEVPEPFCGSVSCSCHSLYEVAMRKQMCDYVFLSPIFNSISKQGYEAAFSDEELADAAERGIIDSKVIALGGVTAERIQILRKWGFGGAAFLGDIWNRMQTEDATKYLESIRNLMTDTLP